MKLKNLTQDEACQTLLTNLPKEARDLLNLFNDVGMPDISFQKLGCLQSVVIDKQTFVEGQAIYAWVYLYKGNIYFVLPGEEKVYAERDKHFYLQKVKKGETISITYGLNPIEKQQENYQLITNQNGKLQLVPAWWLDASKVINYYFNSAQRVTYSLQQISKGEQTFFAWRLISVKPVSIQWFLIEHGKFVSSCDMQKHLRAFPKNELPFELNNGIITFK